MGGILVAWRPRAPQTMHSRWELFTSAGGLLRLRLALGNKQLAVVFRHPIIWENEGMIFEIIRIFNILSDVKDVKMDFDPVHWIIRLSCTSAVTIAAICMCGTREQYGTRVVLLEGLHACANTPILHVDERVCMCVVMYVSVWNRLYNSTRGMRMAYRVLLFARCLYCFTPAPRCKDGITRGDRMAGEISPVSRNSFLNILQISNSKFANFVKKENLYLSC